MVLFYCCFCFLLRAPPGRSDHPGNLDFSVPKDPRDRGVQRESGDNVASLELLETMGDLVIMAMMVPLDQSDHRGHLEALETRDHKEPK